MYVQDIARIMSYSVMATPVLVIDEKLSWLVIAARTKSSKRCAKRLARKSLNG